MTAPDENAHARLRNTGMIGAGVAAICCFTPALVVIVTGVGLTAIVGWLDYALFPMLFASLGVVAYAFWLESGRLGPSPGIAIILLVGGISAALFWLEFRLALPVSMAALLAVVLYWLFLRGRRARIDAGQTPDEVHDV